MRSSCRLGDRRTDRPRAARVTHFLTTRPLWPSLPLSSQVLNSFKTTDLSFAERKSALERIIDLQNRSETLGIGIRDRFGASEAYGNVVLRRLDRMNVKPAPGTQNFQGVVRKRLEPALRTYRSAGERLDETTDAVARASNLLRCQIDLDVQEQNDNLLILGTILSVSSFSLAIVQFLEKVDVL